jgi:3'-phosphoadenosine 5'-phosphosulfate sulfotransferase (PAPS reductase)/FAD synthetase
MEALKGVDVGKHVLFVNTTVMIPPAQEFVEETCRRFSWPLVVLRPKRTFEEFVLEGHREGSQGWGMPTMRRRWCCFALKLEPIFRFCASLRGRVGCVTGLRRWESRRRRSYGQVMFAVYGDPRLGLKRTEVWNYSPILDWGEEEVSRYLRRHGLSEPPWYRMGIKETCACGVFMTEGELEAVALHFPEFFRRFLDLEERFREGGKCFFLRGRPAGAREVWERVRPRTTLREFLEGSG